MAHQTLTASETGQQKIREAIEVKKWKVSQDDTRPLVAASLEYIKQYQAEHRLADKDTKWLIDFEQIFRVETTKNQPKAEIDQKIKKIKLELVAKTKQATLLQSIKEKIEYSEIYVKNISWGTWSRFASKKKKPVNEIAFKIYCDILGLDWRKIAENNTSHKIRLEIKNKFNNSDEVLIVEEKPSVNLPYQNLPHPKYTKFIGRQRTLPSLLKHLSLKSNISKISIKGIGGIGKTSLILEAAYYCLRASLKQSDENYQYDAIIFTSFKQQEITNQGKLITSYQRQLCCQQILNNIARTLNKKELIKLDFDNCVEEVIDLLRHYKTLLIVDNLETVEDLDNTIWFLDKLPNTVKVIITSREEKGFGQIGIPLDTLNESALELIQYESELRNITLTPEESLQIYDKTCKIPLAIVLVIGQLANDYSFEYVIKNLSNGSNDIVRYCFESSVRPLKGKASYKLLTALALFSKIPSDKIISEVANVIDDKPREIGFAELRQLRLIQHFSERYEMLPIIRSYVLAELKNDFEWESKLRNRWVNWYKEFVNKYGSHQEKQWDRYEQLEEEWENITDVISWCISHNRYDDVKYFWQWIKSYSHIRGYQSDRLVGWNARLEWTDWLIKNAIANQDYAIASEVMFERAWTLTLIGKTENLAQAAKLFAELWLGKNYYTNLVFKIDLAIHIAYFRFQQEKFTKSRNWLNYADKLMQNSQLIQNDSSRQLILLNYYRGQIYFNQQNYQYAKQLFEEALKWAKIINDQKGASLCKKWLGDIAIELEDFQNAEEIFQERLRIVEGNKDRVGIAFCQQSYFFLEKARGNFSQAQIWATKAIDNFNKLGIIREAEVTQKMLNDLNGKQTQKEA